MKRFTSILAGLALASSAQAADTVDMKWNAEMRTRYTNDTHNRGVSKGRTENSNSIAQRNKLGLHLTRGENFQGHVSLINNFTWGGAGRTVPGSYTYGTVDTNNVNNLLLVNEAYGWWKFNDMMSIKFGRSAMEIAGGFVSSAYNWSANPYSFDGVWTMWDFEPVSLNLFGTKLNDQGTATDGNNDPEAVMYGAVVGVKNLPDVLKKAEIHLLQHNDETTNPNSTLVTTSNFRTEVMRYGLYVGGDTMNLDYRAAADMYSGKFKVFTGGTSTDYNVTGTMFDLGAGYTFPEFMMFRLGAVYHMDSGGDAPNSTDKKDFKNYMPFHYDRHAHGGTYLDAVTWGNLTYWSLDGSIQPMEDLTARLRYTVFTRSSDKNSVNVYGTASGTTASGYTSSNDIGTEIDFTLKKKYGDNFSIWALYGVFTPGDLVKKDNVYAGAAGTQEEDSHTRIQLQGKLTF